MKHHRGFRTGLGKLLASISRLIDKIRKTVILEARRCTFISGSFDRRIQSPFEVKNAKNGDMIRKKVKERVTIQQG